MFKLNRIFKNISYVIVTNLVTLVVSVITTAILPKVMGVTEYSYWQLYMFYSTYVIYLQLGWLEGIYLREGGNAIESLDKGKYSAQFWYLLFYGVVLGILILCGVKLAIDVPEKQYVFAFVAIYMVVIFLKTYFSYIFQATDQISYYAKINIGERCIFGVSLILMIALGISGFRQMIICDIFSRCIALVLAMYYGRKLIFTKPQKLKDTTKEIGTNVAVGSKLMFATVTGLLIVGIIRWGIEQHWNVETFGKVSFTISISNLVITFIGAVSVVLFPMLRHIKEKERLINLYQHIRSALGMIGFFALVFYLPLKVVIGMWLPDYVESVRYMALIFPMCFYESKMSILVLTFLKTLRKEKTILQVNVISVLVSVCVAAVTILVCDNLILAVLGILVVLAFKCILAEILLTRHLEINEYKMIVQELLLTILFVAANWCIGGVAGFCMYLAGFLCYIVINRKDFKNAVLFFGKKVRA